MLKAEPVLAMTDISKRYGQAYAVEGVSFTVLPGQVHALLGENGAGKSTLAKIMAGATTPDTGTIVIHGEERSFRTPEDATLAGVTMVYQENSLVDTMTVAQNMFLGQERPFNRLSPLNLRATAILSSHNFHIRPEVLVGSLGAAQKQMVEIARGMHRRAKLLILDEPTASVTPEEKIQLFLSMEELKSKGVGIVFITHNLEEALQNADRITVLKDGVVQASGLVGEFNRDRIVRLMVGRAVEYVRLPSSVAPRPQPALQVQAVALPPMVRNMSFSVRPGEIVGIAGLVGSGRSEVAAIVAGISKRRRMRGGTVRLNGRSVRYRTPRQALKDGIVYVTEDRKASGFFADLSITDNIFVGYASARRWLPFLTTAGSRRRVARPLIDRFAIRALDPGRAKLSELSGGNQQKVVLAKALTSSPRVVIVDEPTRGVDVGAIEEIHRIIRRLADDGAAVVVISSYLPEVIALSDRILVARQGSIVAEFDPGTADEQSILFAMVH
jgi:ABC-type sugar transport system ATPase subunit